MTAYAIIRQELEACRKILAGETVNGVKLGDAGITREWVEATYNNLLYVAGLTKEAA